LHGGVRGIGAALALAAVGMAAVLALSGGAASDPPAPQGFPGVRPSFLGGAGVAREGERRWLARSEPLAAAAPAWARRLHARSLLVLRALIDLRSGAAVAGARAGWAYVWPRDAAAVAIALARAGYRSEAGRIVNFLHGLDLDAAARFYASGEPVPGREAQGDAAGWVATAAQAAAIAPRRGSAARLAALVRPFEWRDRADYQEKEGGNYLGNAIASGVDPDSIRKAFASPRGLVRRAGDFASGLETAAAWAVRPFAQPALFEPARRTLRRLAAASGRFGLLPSEDWDGGEDPWTAPTAWTAWSLAALAREDRRAGALALARRERRAALRLMVALRRTATPLGLLPERVDAATGAPRSTTPLAWSHAFAILALRELWPGVGAVDHRIGGQLHPGSPR
jgi:glucoamylase